MTIILNQSYEKLGLKWGIIVDQTEQELYQPINFLAKVLWVLGGVSLVIAMIVLYVFASNLVKPIIHITQNLQKIRQDFDFSQRIKVISKDETGQMAEATNALLESLQQAIAEANTTVYALSEGDFSKRVEKDYAGDLDALKQGINRSADNITHVIEQLSDVMQALRDGRFDFKIQISANGQYKVILNNAAQTMHDLNSVIADINAVMGTLITK